LPFDATIAGDNLQPSFVQHGCHALHDEKQGAFHQPHGNGGDDGIQDAQARCLGQCFLATLLLLLGLPIGIGGWLPLLRMVNRTIRVGADFAEFAFLSAFRDEGLCAGFASLVLRPIALLVAPRRRALRKRR